MSHAEGTCFCGCTGTRQSAEQGLRQLDTALTTAAAQHSGARDGWSHEEDVLLEQRFRDGALISQLSGLHERRPSAIIARLEQLGLVEPRRRTA